MRNWAKNTSRAALVAAGAVAVGTGFGSAGAVAHADMRTAGNFSVLGGNQVVAPISIPVDVSGNSVAALVAASQAQSKGGAEVEHARHGGHGGDMETAGNFSIGGGNQVVAPISVPVNVCGNSVAALAAFSQAYCKGGAEVEFENDGHGHGHGHDDRGYRAASTERGHGHGKHGKHGKHGHGADMKTSGNFSILGGNQIVLPISAPINVCGNSVAVVGLSKAQCKGGARSEYERSGKPDMKTAGNFSILGGNQVVAPISVPINVCGNSVAVVGLSKAQCKGGASVGDGDDHELPPTLRKGGHAPGTDEVTGKVGKVGETVGSVAGGALGRVGAAAPVAQPAAPVANERAAAPAERTRKGGMLRGLVKALTKTAPVTDTAGKSLPLDQAPVEVARRSRPERARSDRGRSGRDGAVRLRTVRSGTDPGLNDPRPMRRRTGRPYATAGRRAARSRRVASTAGRSDRSRGGDGRRAVPPRRRGSCRRTPHAARYAAARGTRRHVGAQTDPGGRHGDGRPRRFHGGHRPRSAGVHRTRRARRPGHDRVVGDVRAGARPRTPAGRDPRAARGGP
ncbi:hypothetical protein BJF79_43730, partial [Actinomadura sp. CNU-125]|uniref:chaplin family protein n=1 Tax=Actinomadura sp. CNU-125 TaxID=1904961 RepID=UPI000968C60C